MASSLSARPADRSRSRASCDRDALGVREAGEPPLAERLQDSWRRRQLLLLLDNFEHLLTAAPAVGTSWVRTPLKCW